MKRIEIIIDQVAAIRDITPSEMLSLRTQEAVFCRHIVAWVSIRALKIESYRVACALGYNTSRNIVTYGCRQIDKEIRNHNDYVIELLDEIICNKELNLIEEKTDGTCSPSDLYNRLSAFLPSVQRSTPRIAGKSYPTDTTVTKQPSSDTSSPTSKDNPSTQKAACRTSHTQHGTRSFCYTSDVNWANREALRYDFATPQERQQIYYALCAASAWGRKCAFENRIRMEELKNLPNTVYVSMID